MMNVCRRTWMWSVWIWTMALVLGSPEARAASAERDYLIWNTRSQVVDARIQAWSLEKLLAEIAQRTGWEVYVEPGTEKTISAKFRQRTSGDALKLLLGDLSFVLLPQTNSSPRLLVFKTSLRQATELIRPEIESSKAKELKNELIVMLKPGSKESIESLANKLGGKVVGSVDALGAHRLAFETEADAKRAREALSEDPSVAGLDSNYLIEVPSRQEDPPVNAPPPFNLKPKINPDGSEVIVGLIDTSVQTLRPEMNEFLLPPIRIAGEPVDSPDLNHGTSMAETILQGLSLASSESGESSVRILPVDVYGPHPDTTTFDVARGVYAAIDAGATIINLSMGGAGDSQFLANLIRETHREGILFFGAAGNDGTTMPHYPAAYPEVVAVTSVDRQGRIAPYANRGHFVDVGAPGTSYVQFGEQTYRITGTSASTAYVSGTAAAFRAAGHPPPAVEGLLRERLAVTPAPAP